MPKLKEMSTEDIERMVSISTVVLSSVVKLVFLITELIKNSDMGEQDKESLIARIRAAQESVPVWE